MKKAIIILMVTIIALAFTACNNDSTNDTPSGNTVSPPTIETELPNGQITLPDMTEKIVALTENDLSYFNGDDFFNGEYLNIRNQFLSSLYSAPGKIDLFQLFYCGSGLEGYKTNYVSIEEMDIILSQYMGLTLAETEKIGLENVVYQEKDAAYVFDHGDTNYRPYIQFASGEREGDTIRLFYEDTYMGEGNKVLTLQKNDGAYWFISNQTTVNTETNQSDYNEPVTTTDNTSAETLPVNKTEIPEEALSLATTYMDAFKIGVYEAVNYIYFSDDWTEGIYLDTNDRLLEYRIKSVEMINDNLIALTIQTRTMVSDETGQTQGEGTYLVVYNFVARIDGEWRFITGVRHIPEVLKDNFDESNYQYGDPNIVDHEDVLLPER